MKQNQQLSDEQVSYLMLFARQELEKVFGIINDKPINESINFDDINYEKLNITLRCRGELLGSQGSKGETFLETLRAAVQDSAKDPRFQRQMVAGDLDSTYIELWVQVGHEDLDNNNLTTIKKKITLGVDGVELTNGSNNAYYKPSVAITSKVSSHKRLLEKLCKKAKLPTNIWQFPKTKIRVTKWLHFVEIKNSDVNFSQLHKLRPVKEEPLTKEKVEKALKAMLNNLISLQVADGKYNYIYQSDVDKHNNEDFNMVRLAGSTYSVTSALAYIEDPRLKEKCQNSAKLALKYLFSYAQETPKGTYIIEQSNKKKLIGKLGTTALTLLSLEFGVFPKEFEKERLALLNMIVSLQKQDGSFKCYINKEDKKIVTQNYYPGEALLALCYEVLNFDNKLARDVIEKSFPYYTKHFYSNPTTAFILWQSDAWSLFYKILAKDKSSDADLSRISKYAQFVFDQVDWLLQFQYTKENAYSQEHIGGFCYPNEPTVSSCTYVESVIKAAILAHSIGLEDKFYVYKEASLKGLEFILRLQLKKEMAFLFPRPELTVGGITNTFLSFNIRNDFDQHGITAFLAALQKAELFFS